MTEALEAHLRRQIEHSGSFFWHRLRWRAVREYLPQDTPFQLIDVGAGAGLLGTFLSKDRPRATYRFVEPIESLRTFLRTTYGDAADAGGDHDYRSAGFITLLDVLEHQEDDRRFLRELVGRMAPGSTLLVTVPAHQRLWSGWDVALGHFRRYEKETLLRCLDGLPLRLVEVSFLFPEMLPPSLVRSRRKSTGGPEAGEEDRAEFPDLPAPVNAVLYRVGVWSLALRRHWRTGTSLFVVARVTGPDRHLDPATAIDTVSDPNGRYRPAAPEGAPGPDGYAAPS